MTEGKQTNSEDFPGDFRLYSEKIGSYSNILCRGIACISVCYTSFSGSTLKSKWQEQRLQAWRAEPTLETAISGDIIGALAMRDEVKSGYPNNTYHLGNPKHSANYCVLSLLIVKQVVASALLYS